MNWIELRCSNSTCGALRDPHGNIRTRPDGKPAVPKLLGRCTTGALNDGAVIEIKCPSCNQIEKLSNTRLHALSR